MADNTKGVWLDKETGKVVRGKAPSRARQLVPPGREATKEEQELVERYEANYAEPLANYGEQPAADVKDDQSKTVTTTRAGGKAKG